MPTSSFQAVWTTTAREKYAINLDSPSLPSVISYFKVGIGGRNSDGSVKVPDPSLTDLEILLYPAQYPQYPNPPYTIPAYGSAIATSFAAPPNSKSIVTPGTISLTCVLDGATYNSDGAGSPVISEVGIFDAANDMVVYGTFSGVTKVSGVTVTLTFDLVL